jgi:hypothetical protein
MATYTIQKEAPVTGRVKIGDIYERAAFTKTEFQAFVAEWRCQKGVIKDDAHENVEVVRVIERRCFGI